MFVNRMRKQVEIAKEGWVGEHKETKALDSSETQQRSPIKRLVMQSRTDFKRIYSGDGEAAFFGQCKPCRILSSDSYMHNSASQNDLEQTIP